MSAYDSHEEEIKAYDMVIHDLRKRIDSLGRSKDQQHDVIAELRIERNGLKRTFALINKAVLSSEAERRLFEERNRRSWK